MHRFSILRYLTVFALIGVFSLVVAACDDDEADDADNGASSDDTEEVDDAEESDDESSDEGSDEEAAGQWHGDREIVFADYNWDSARVLNRISQFIVEEGYGYETDTVPGETIPLFQGQLDGDIDISMEIWVDQMPPYQPALDEGTVVELGNSVDDTVQGWWVPTYVIEGDEERGIEPMAPDLESVDDLPDYWEVFQDPEDDSKGRLYDGIAGWEAERINEVKFDYYGLDETYNRFLPGSNAALDTSLQTAYDQGEPWLGYMWTPTWIAGQLDLTLIEEPEYTDECWEEVQAAVEEERTPETSCAWPITEAVIASTSAFADEAPDIIAFLEEFNTSEPQISATLSYMAENEVDADEAALWFLDEYEDMWTEWVPEDVVENVQDALDN
ncbi:MAG: ABC transporter substrate-binding protein [Thermomicrobiaceae bacterium]